MSRVAQRRTPQSLSADRASRPSKRAANSEAARQAAIKATLDGVRAREDLRARRANDPVDFVHAYERRADRELVALVAANLAFGNVKAIRMKVADLLRRVGPSPAKAADDEAALHAALEGWKHRVFKGEDVARLLVGARRVQREDGSLGAAFARALREADRTAPSEHEGLREALAAFCDRIRIAGGLPRAGEPLVERPGGRRSEAAPPVPPVDGAPVRRDRPRPLAGPAAPPLDARGRPHPYAFEEPRLHEAPGRVVEDGRRNHGRAGALRRRRSDALRLLALPHGDAAALSFPEGRRPLRRLRCEVGLHPVARRRRRPGFAASSVEAEKNGVTLRAIW